MMSFNWLYLHQFWVQCEWQKIELSQGIQHLNILSIFSFRFIDETLIAKNAQANTHCLYRLMPPHFSTPITKLKWYFVYSFRLASFWAPRRRLVLLSRACTLIAPFRRLLFLRSLRLRCRWCSRILLFARVSYTPSAVEPLMWRCSVVVGNGSFRAAWYR